MREMLRDIEDRCTSRGLAPPSRATVYRLMASLACPTYRVGDLPGPVRRALYNLGPGSEVPGHQVAFYCFNYGEIAAVSFASGLPWLALYQALRLPGYRKKSRGLIEAAAAARGIRDGRA